MGLAADALAAGPASFLELMAAEGSRDGRDVLRQLEPLYAAGRLSREPDGPYRLRPLDKTAANLPMNEAAATHPKKSVKNEY